MNIETIITKSIVEVIKELYGEEFAADTIQLQKTRKEFEGDFTLVVFPFLKVSKKRAEDTAQEIGALLIERQPLAASFNVVKGFLNILIAPSYWIELLKNIDEKGQRKFAPCDGRILIAQHQQTFAPGTHPQQSSRICAIKHNCCKR